MSNDANQTSFTYNGPLSARMACHMGDTAQSAICNILGDEPLFYIDYVQDEQDETLDTLAGADIPADFYADNLDELRMRMHRLESASHHIDAYNHENVETAFESACKTLCGTQTTLDLADIKTLITSSRITTSLYEQTSAKGLTLVMDAHVDTTAYNRDQKTIHINPRLSADFAVLSLAPVLRQAWLHMQGTCVNPLFFQPEEAILLNRIQQADLAIMAIRAAWEANLSGNKKAWERLLSVSAYDLAVGFAREAIADFRALNTGAAASVSFERWFFSGRCHQTDRKLIQQMLADNHGLVFEHPQTSRIITSDVIARTGETPAGKNYLSPLINMVQSDPLFTEVRDRSNANFLWFIKFERSFRETEEGMEQPLHSSIARSNTQEASDHANSATIIPFTGRTQNSVQTTARTGTNDGAVVYYLDHFISLSNR